MKKQLLCLSLAICAAILLISTAFAANPGETAGIQITGQRFEGTTTFQFTVHLTAAEMRGEVFVAVYAQNAQIKSIEEYPAAAEIPVSLRNVLNTDTIKAMWLDEYYMPLDKADVPQKVEVVEPNQDAFANTIAGLIKSYDNEVIAQAALQDPYASARLIVRSSDPLPNLDGYGVVQQVSDTEGHTILQFSNPDEAKACESYLASRIAANGYVTPDAYEQIPKEYDNDADATKLSWGVSVIHADSYAAQLLKRGINREITVAVVDSGVDYNHSVMENRITSGDKSGYDFVDNDSKPMDEHYHGTHVAGTIVDCTPGLTNLKIMPVRVLGAAGGGTVLNVASGIRYAADHGANVINLSLGGLHSPYKDEAIEYAISKNVTVVVAAGNQGTNADGHCPAHIKKCITVAAVDKNMKPADFSNYGNAVDLAAPGVGIKSSTPNNKYDELSGTSMASPHVAACAALLLEESPSLTPAQMEKKLIEKVQVPSGWNKKYGAGVVNMEAEAVFYAIFYEDGELVFQNSATPASGRTPDETYQINAAVEPAYALWYSKRDNITTVTFAEEVHPLSTALWFLKCTNLTTIRNPQNLKTESVTDMSQMFSGCTGLKTLDLRGFDTKNVKNMSQMFFKCDSLTTILVSDAFNVSNVTESADMFTDCNALRQRYPNAPTDKTYARIDNPPSYPGYFTSETGEQGHFYAIFYEDGELVFQNSDKTASGRGEPKVFQINAAVEPAHALWYSLRENITTVTFAEEVHPQSTALWFLKCTNLTTIRNPQNLKTESVTDMSQMFSGCTGLKTLDLRGFDTKNVKNMCMMFFGCSSLTTILVSDAFSVSQVTDSADMFTNCSALVGEQGTKYNSNYTGKTYARVDEGTSKPGYFKKTTLPPPPPPKLYAVLYDNGELKFQTNATPESGRTAVKSYTTDSGGYDENVESYTAWYEERDKIKSVNFSVSISPTSTALWFYGCKNLSAVQNPGNLHTDYVTDMSQMFAYCSSLTSLDLSAFNTAKVKDTSMMFYHCDRLKTIYASRSFKTEQVEDSMYMFGDCAALRGGNGTPYSSDRTDKTYARIDSASTPGYFTAK